MSAVGADIGREALYAAELAAFDGTSYESLRPFADLSALARRVTDAEWWPHGPVELVAARSDAESSSTRQWASERPVVRLAFGQMTQATLLHELAHVLAGVDAGHGPRFRRAYVDLVGFAWGAEPAGWLRHELDAMRLSLGTRSWPMPPVQSGGGGGRRDSDVDRVGDRGAIVL
jgi:hypothetical protein